MKRIFSKITAALTSAALCLSAYIPAASAQETSSTDISLTNAIETIGGITINSDKISTNNFKNTKFNNPVSPDFFCADPTAVEYNGRLYLYGTNDHEQFEVKGPDVDNTYEQIKSMVVLSTDDMVNWTYHGEINIGEIAPWIVNSWAPSIVSRVEDDGLTHFYLYFSNNGLGTGVIHATNPLGPWDDPLGKPLISSSTPGLTDCPNPFDPGAVIDDNGVGWLSFGAGMASDGTTYMPGSNRIVRLGDDMVSIDSEFAEIPAPYHFEASELNYINGTYVYTYNTDWSDHSKQWDYDCDVPSQCSMVYMTTKTPLDPESWEMKGECFINPGTAGFEYSNNHTHMHKFKGKWYMFFHTLSLKTGMGITGSYRSLCVDEITVDEENVVIEKTGGTKAGVDAISSIDPFTVNAAASLNTTADITYDTSDAANPVVISSGEGSWIGVRDAEFTASAAVEEPDAPVVLEATDIDTITYDITVSAVDKATTLSMHPASSDGANHTGSVEVDKTGNYTITCDIGGSSGMMNMGYFTASDDAVITFVIDTMTVNGKYVFDMATELTNTREWADGLRNIWNGFSDGDKVYSSDYAEFVYSASSDSIEFMASDSISANDPNANAPLVENPLRFFGNVKGTGRVEVRLDAPDGDILTAIDFNSSDKFTTIYSDEVAAIGGTHDLYFVFSGSDISFSAWKFAEITGDDTPIAGDVNADRSFNVADLVMMQKYILGAEALTDEAAGDIISDGKINVFDLIAMRKAISNQ